MVLEPPRDATVTLSDVARFGPYTLRRLTDRHYQLTGPDAAYPADWLRATLPGYGEWWTEWVGSADTFILDITRD